MLLIDNQQTDPYYNMALEEYFLSESDEKIIILWRNEPCVVVGKNQNTMDEINREYVEENGMAVVRRLSGGGAVVHDLGNLNFTVIENSAEGKWNDFSGFIKPVCDFLNRKGIPAKADGRNDIIVHGSKISGNAQTVKNNRILYHGTLLFDVDLDRLGKALKPNPVKYESKGIPSVRSRVTNIRGFLEEPVTIELFTQELFQYFSETNHCAVRYYVSAKEECAISKLAHNKYSTWEWNYGASPGYNFSRCKRYDFGTVEVRIDVESGIIQQAGIYGDFFSSKEKHQLEEMLAGKKHNRQEIVTVLDKINLEEYISGMKAGELADLLM